MSFDNKRISLNNTTCWEIIRFCNKIDYNIIGSASKLFKYFIKNINPQKVISYCDKSKFDGDVYYKLGMTKEIEYKEVLGYTYISDNNKYVRMNRYKFRKDILVKDGFDKTKSETKIMSERGYNKIWDCGNYKFVYKLII